MIISADTYIPFPLPLVYATYRDKLVEVVSYLPDVRGIEVKSRSEKNGLIQIVNEWHGGGEIPVVARAILSEAMLSWTDFATWNDADFTTGWRIKTHAFTEAVYCSGKNRFLEKNGGTQIESRGELIIDTKQIKNVPQLLVGPVARTVEDFLSKKIEPNLQQVGEGVRLYLKNC
ncbi:MAG: hypothetical protein DSM106950_31275 [Stigonema ocellatum SAG 48.90 = DSM 106950]|nr:hypothetical protein [Stigonema ocellatum SAG 48.90 = DSM 106950]